MMANSFFDYALSLCKIQSISPVCKRFSASAQLRQTLETNWSIMHDFIDDSELYFEISNLLYGNKQLHVDLLSEDAKTLLDRCRTTHKEIRREWRETDKLDYNRLFDNFVDICWLLASIHASTQAEEHTIELLSNPIQIRKAIRNYLEELYEMAIKDYHECFFISEAIAAKKEHPFKPERYKNKYTESEWYINSNWTSQDLRDEKSRCDNRFKHNMIIYFGLTATCALAYNIRREV